MWTGRARRGSGLPPVEAHWGSSGSLMNTSASEALEAWGLSVRLPPSLTRSCVAVQEERADAAAGDGWVLQVQPLLRGAARAGEAADHPVKAALAPRWSVFSTTRSPRLQTGALPACAACIVPCCSHDWSSVAGRLGWRL